VPVASAPAWFLAVAWIGMAVLLAGVLLFLHHLRRIFQRVRSGAPFDITNANRLRWMGFLLLALHAAMSSFAYWLSVMVTRSFETGEVEFGAWFILEPIALFIALVLLALAEVFRRGALLEAEQALVV
jgi:hypothetical protein